MPQRQYAVRLEPLLAQAAAYARSILRHRDDAEDAVQQAALRGFERVHTYDENRPFKGWWFAILRNCCVDAMRRSKSAVTQGLEGIELPASPLPDPFDWEPLNEALSRLSEDHREILRLRYFAELNYRELAETLNIPQGTVMSRLYLARKALRAQLSGEPT